MRPRAGGSILALLGKEEKFLTEALASATQSVDDEVLRARVLAYLQCFLMSCDARSWDRWPTGPIPLPAARFEPRRTAALLPTGLPRFHRHDPLARADWELDELMGVSDLGECAPAASMAKSGRSRLNSVPTRQSCITCRAMKRQRSNDVSFWSAFGSGAADEMYLEADPPCLVYEFVDGPTWPHHTCFTAAERSRSLPSPGQPHCFSSCQDIGLCPSRRRPCSPGSQALNIRCNAAAMADRRGG